MSALSALFFEQPNALQRLNLLRMIVVVQCFFLLLFGPYDTLFHIESATLMFRPLFPFPYFPEPGNWFALLKGASLALAVPAFFGRRSALLLFTLCYCTLNYTVHCYQAHFCMNLAHLNFALIALCYAGRDPDRASWTLTLIASLIVLIFFQAGLAKLLYGGIGWFTSGDTLYVETILDGTDFGRRLTQFPFFFPMMGVLTGIFELGLPLLFLFRRAHPWIAVLLMTFHMGTFLVMGISFWFLWPLYVPLFFPLSRLYRTRSSILS